MNPWRAVTKVEKLPSISSRHHPTRLTLACGHTLLIRGEKAWDARTAKRKRCAQCSEDEARLQARIAADQAKKNL